MALPDHVTRFSPLVPEETLVVEINRIFHRYEAPLYQKRHKEIYDALPAIWNAMIDRFLARNTQEKISILDFGCGSGFEAGQLLARIPAQSISRFTCYDLSDDMLRECRDALGGNYPFVEWTSNLDEILSRNEPYTILATNSLLHHLPDPTGMLQQLSGILTPDAVWFNGHEPSVRYYLNPDCVALLNEYRAIYNRQKWFSPRILATKFWRTLFPHQDPYRMTAVTSVEENLFQTRPSLQAIASLVDFHVPHTVEEIESGRGFNFQKPSFIPEDAWELEWSETYNYLGSFAEHDAPQSIRQRCHDLATRFPDDGCNYSALWRRKTQP